MLRLASTASATLTVLLGAIALNGCGGGSSTAAAPLTSDSLSRFAGTYSGTTSPMGTVTLTVWTNGTNSSDTFNLLIAPANGPGVGVSSSVNAAGVFFGGNGPGFSGQIYKNAAGAYVASGSWSDPLGKTTGTWTAAKQ